MALITIGATFRVDVADPLVCETDESVDVIDTGAVEADVGLLSIFASMGCVAASGWVAASPNGTATGLGDIDPNASAEYPGLRAGFVDGLAAKSMNGGVNPV